MLESVIFSRISCSFYYQFRSFQFSCSVVSNSLWPHEPQHTRPPCPSPAPGVHPNSCPLSRWCHPPILSSVIPFSSRSQSFPALGSFQISQLFTSGGQSIGVSASTSVLLMNTRTDLSSAVIFKNQKLGSILFIAIQVCLFFFPICLSTYLHYFNSYATNTLIFF